MKLDLNEILIENPKEIINEYRVLKTQNKEIYNDNTAKEFLQDKTIHYINLGQKIEEEKRIKILKTLNEVEYSDKIKSHDDKQVVAALEVLDYDNKINEIKNLLEILKFVNSLGF